MAIKKAFTEINNLLAANMDSTVEEIYEQAVELMSAKSGGGGAAAYVKDDAGNVVGLHCSYHKLWFKPAIGETEEEIAEQVAEGLVEFGAKKSTASGFNNFSKDGMSKWTKQLSVFKKGKEELLQKVMDGELEREDIAPRLADLEAAREEIVPMEDVIGYETAEALVESL